MSAKEYQHKRFRDRAFGRDRANRPSSGSHPSVSAGIPMDATPPRLVTPTQTDYGVVVSKKESMGSDRAVSSRFSVLPPSPDFVHHPTANENSLTYISPMKADHPMRYSLTNGVENVSPGLSDEVNGKSRNRSARMAKELFPGRVSSSASPSTSAGGTSRRRSDDHLSSRKTSTGGGSSKLLSSGIRKYDPSSCKIFLLLLQPKLKTFELIQLIYSPNDTTIGEILRMIPENATEPALGTQTYNGLCRPKTQEEILDHELLASESNSSVVSAKITLGEILVAIPEGYTGADVAVLAKQILGNPKIVKLLKRADPLAPKKSHRSSKRHRTTRRSRSKEHVEVMEKFDEEDEIRLEQERKMKEAMEHAAQEAAAANAAIPGFENGPNVAVPGKLSRSMSITSTSDKSVESSLQESVDDSYSSWSKSFDASFASSVCSGVSRRAVRRRDREARRMRILQRASAMAFVVMLALYFLDPRGYGRADNNTEQITDTPMGFTGVFQCLFLLLALYKVERLVRTSTNPDLAAQNDGQRRCPFLKAVNSSMKKFKSRYSKKLRKPIMQGKFEDDDHSLSQRLRRFSLKTSSIQSIHDSNGSL